MESKTEKPLIPFQMTSWIYFCARDSYRKRSFWSQRHASKSLTGELQLADLEKAESSGGNAIARATSTGDKKEEGGSGSEEVKNKLCRNVSGHLSTAKFSSRLPRQATLCSYCFYLCSFFFFCALCVTISYRSYWPRFPYPYHICISVPLFALVSDLFWWIGRRRGRGRRRKWIRVRWRLRREPLWLGHGRDERRERPRSHLLELSSHRISWILKRLYLEPVYASPQKICVRPLVW